MISAVRISVDGKAESLSVDESRISQAINAEFVQAISVDTDAARPVSFFVDEEGKLNQLPPNPAATALIRQWLAREERVLLPGDFLAGAVLVTGGVDDEGANLGIDARDAAVIIDFCVGWAR